jgi:hypothetical protein
LNTVPDAPPPLITVSPAGQATLTCPGNAPVKTVALFCTTVYPDPGFLLVAQQSIEA